MRDISRRRIEALEIQVQQETDRDRRLKLCHEICEIEAAERERESDLCIKPMPYNFSVDRAVAAAIRGRSLPGCASWA